MHSATELSSKLLVFQTTLIVDVIVIVVGVVIVERQMACGVT